jgi:serine/threonine-protein kinase
MQDSHHVSDLIEHLNRSLGERFRFEGELGRGGMGTVYLAEDLKHDRQVAIKLLRFPAFDSTRSHRFIREIRTTACLTHPHIVSLYDSGEIEGAAYYVMEYIQGESLRQRISRLGPLPLELTSRIVCDIASALDYANDQGFVHRDVKPENILVDSDDDVWIADFGLARAISQAANSRLTANGQAIGSPHYMSPEQASGSIELDGRSDQYSLACVCFEMLTGRPPFFGEAHRSIIAQHLTSPPPPLRSLRPDLPRGLDTALSRALAKDPDDRFATAHNFAEAVRLVTREGAYDAHRTLFTSWFRLSLAAAAAILLVFAALFWTGADPPVEGDNSHSGPYPANRLAVLYFGDGSPDGSLRHIAEGLTDRLTHELAQVAALDVVPINGVRLYRDDLFPIDSLIKGLRVATLVRGNVERYGDHLRVYVQLLDATTRSLIASDTTIRPFQELFSVQDDIAEKVANFLRRRLGREVTLRARRAETRNPDALALVMRAEVSINDGLALTRTIDPAATSTSLRLFNVADSILELARVLDPQWEEPVILRGWTHWYRGAYSAGNERELLFHDAIRYANAALAIQRESLRAHELRGTAFFRLASTFLEHPSSGEWLTNAERDLSTAVAADRSLASAWSTLSSVLRLQGRFSEASLAAQIALEEDAYLTEANQIIHLLHRTSLNLGRDEEAIQWCQKGRRDFPGDWRFLECELSTIAWIESTAPDPLSAWRILRQLDQVDPHTKAVAVGRPYSSGFRRMLVASVLARSNLADSARAVMEQIRQGLPDDFEIRLDFSYDEACLTLMLGNPDQALLLLKQYLDQRPHLRSFVSSDPRLQSLRSDQRFNDLVRES